MAASLTPLDLTPPGVAVERPGEDMRPTSLSVIRSRHPVSALVRPVARGDIKARPEVGSPRCQRTGVAALRRDQGVYFLGTRSCHRWGPASGTVLVEVPLAVAIARVARWADVDRASPTG